MALKKIHLKIVMDEEHYAGPSSSGGVTSGDLQMRPKSGARSSSLAAKFSMQVPKLLPPSIVTRNR